MKLIRYNDNGIAKIAIDCEKGLVDVEKTAQLTSADVPHRISEVISGGETALSALRKLTEGEVSLVDGTPSLLTPVENPEKILCVGLNYYDHRKECNEFPEAPKDPVLFSKFSNALAAHNEAVPLSPIAREYDYEAELVIIIGKTAKNVPVEKASEYIFGYTAGNDISARDLQFRSGQWLIGKSMDKFAPIGPCIVTADEINAENLAISCKLNGETRQSASTADMIFKPAEIVAYASSLMTLNEGDIIFTGTPSGVILGMKDENKQWIKSGDTVEVTIEGIGTLTNSFE